jgi:crotonobetainyl-CoA:carnitine CoA-transferase CaiB-like acyl-CoA transferase
MAPCAGAILSDWGAEVIKVENPRGGDPLRYQSADPDPAQTAGNAWIQQCNRGKKSICIDIADPAGHGQLLELAARADVFLTNYLPTVRQKLKIDVDVIRRANPGIVYARAHGQGVHGPDADRRSFDATTFYARSGLASYLSHDADGPPLLPRAMGDSMGGMALAGGIAAALLGASRTQCVQPPVVDVSLLSTALWAMNGTVVSENPQPQGELSDLAAQANPLRSKYRTKDGRWIILHLLPADKYWADLCICLRRTDLIDHPDYRTDAGRVAHYHDCTAELSAAFAAFTLDECKQALAPIEGAWAPVQTTAEVAEDPQVIANGYLPAIEVSPGESIRLVGNPVQFDEKPVVLRSAPRLDADHSALVAGGGPAH